MQRDKLDALGLWPLVDAVVVADDYGRDNWKPSVVPFLACCKLLSVAPQEAVYVGDNPERDMRGARDAGMKSVRLRHPQGCFRDSACGSDVADYEITCVSQLEALLEKLTGA